MRSYILLLYFSLQCDYFNTSNTSNISNISNTSNISNISNISNTSKCIENELILNFSKYTTNTNTNNSICILCKSLVYVIDYGIIKGNKTIEEITTIIKDICCEINGPRGKECVLVLNNIQEIIKYISNGLTEIQICKKLNLCV